MVSGLPYQALPDGEEYAKFSSKMAFTLDRRKREI
jgi:hypothetical protein